jgi:hypothetical protein
MAVEELVAIAIATQNPVIVNAIRRIRLSKIHPRLSLRMSGWFDSIHPAGPKKPLYIEAADPRSGKADHI